MDSNSIKSVQDIADRFLSDFKDVEENDDDDNAVEELDTEENEISDNVYSDDVQIAESDTEKDFSDIFSDF